VAKDADKVVSGLKSKLPSLGGHKSDDDDSSESGEGSEKKTEKNEKT
jgi:hypothetical protein